MVEARTCRSTSPGRASSLITVLRGIARRIWTVARDTRSMTSLTPRTSSADIRRSFGSTAGLLWTLVRTDFTTRYHGTLGGYVWALLKPLTMFLVLMSVFSFVFSNTPKYRLELIVGLFLYEFFQEGTRTGLESLRTKGY